MVLDWFMLVLTTINRVVNESVKGYLPHLLLDFQNYGSIKMHPNFYKSVINDELFFFTYDPDILNFLVPLLQRIYYF